MAGFKLPSADEAAANSYGVLEEDDYIARIEQFIEVTRDNQFAKRDADGKPLPTFDVIMKPLGFADAPDSELVDQDGEPLNPEKTLRFFFDPHRLGTRPVVARSRKFLAAALGVAPDASIDLPGGLNDLIGKEMIVTVGIKDGNNKILEVRAAKKRARVRVAPVAAAPEPEVDEEDAF